MREKKKIQGCLDKWDNLILDLLSFSNKRLFAIFISTISSEILKFNYD